MTENYAPLFRTKSLGFRVAELFTHEHDVDSRNIYLYIVEPHTHILQRHTSIFVNLTTDAGDITSINSSSILSEWPVRPRNIGNTVVGMSMRYIREWESKDVLISVRRRTVIGIIANEAIRYRNCCFRMFTEN